MSDRSLPDASPAEQVDLFLRASVSGPIRRAVELLADDPAIADHDVTTAVVLGDAARVRRMLADDPGWALRPVQPWGWPPLLGVCGSRWHRDPRRAAGLLAVATLLLDAGADPNTRVDEGADGGRCSTLYAAAGCANNPAITALLLQRGAVPDDHTLYLAAFSDDHECLRLMLPYARDIAASTALAVPISGNDLAGVRMLLDAGVDPDRPLPAELFGEDGDDRTGGAVASAVRNDCDVDLVELLLLRGADPNTPDVHGWSPYRLALRRGRLDVADLVARHGATDDAEGVDRLLAACLRADRVEALRIVAAEPGLLAGLADAEQAALVHAADHGDVEAVRLLLDLGFDVDTPTGADGATPLHAAAAAGSADVVRVLLARGADLNSLDSTWHSTPINWAVVGSAEHLGHDPHADRVATVRVLLAAGAVVEQESLTGDKPPSAEVAALLRAQGG